MTSTTQPSEIKMPISKELLYKLEDQYSEYRYACNNGYCKSDPLVHAKYKEDIAEMTTKLESSN